MDQVGARVTMPDKALIEPSGLQPVLVARGLIKTFGRVVALDGADFDLNPHEILAVIGDNGAGKSTLIKCLAGAIQPDEGVVLMDGRPVDFRRPQDARDAGIETVYQTLAVAPALKIDQNIYLGRERRAAGILGKVFRKLDKAGMMRDAEAKMAQLGVGTLQDMRQTVETLSSGQRQAVAVARAAAFASKVIVLDEPTAAMEVRSRARCSTSFCAFVTAACPSSWSATTCRTYSNWRTVFTCSGSAAASPSYRPQPIR